MPAAKDKLAICASAREIMSTAIFSKEIGRQTSGDVFGRRSVYQPSNLLFGNSTEFIQSQESAHDAQLALLWAVVF
jgi:hypothetical protein